VYRYNHLNKSLCYFAWERLLWKIPISIESNQVNNKLKAFNSNKFILWLVNDTGTWMWSVKMILSWWEELVILVPTTKEDELDKIIERIRINVNKNVFRF